MPSTLLAGEAQNICVVYPYVAPVFSHIILTVELNVRWENSRNLKLETVEAGKLLWYKFGRTE